MEKEYIKTLLFNTQYFIKLKDSMKFKITKLDILNTQIKCYYYNIQISLFIRRNIKYRLLSNIILLVFIPFFLIRWLICSIIDIFLEKKTEDRKNINTNFAYNLGIVAICKNEGSYIKEWVEYHRLVGIDKFYIYDNESDDNTYSILKEYIDSNIVKYTFFPGKAKQLEAYNDAIQNYKNECKYMAFIDLDEFIYLKDKSTNIFNYIDNIINSYKGASGLGINWCIFGSSGKIEREEGLVIERFLYASDAKRGYNHHIKTICNPREVKKYISPHFPLYRLGAHSINEEGLRLYAWYNVIKRYNNIRINHYFTKSKSEFIQKRARGLADRTGKYNLEKFTSYDLNDEYDSSMLYYAKQIKKDYE